MHVWAAVVMGVRTGPITTWRHLITGTCLLPAATASKSEVIIKWREPDSGKRVECCRWLDGGLLAAIHPVLKL